MSQLFYEAIELVAMGEEADRVRAEITGKTALEAAEILQTVKDIMLGLNYRLIKHTCWHDEHKPCEESEI